ncbi:FxsA family protein [Marinimicrobium sp. ABcell2]|uniref:FxsA family protein n=1 Tax=Marinimicrobium sp. ABcell2 TaxID=3069751 RepID=UPI0027B0517E|nr:FxsA family protein [Marinimicrobium sp. ABcell2]MDQ2078294.1 FxsA family protein [Marinimicrobium sp. ABcell2]
MRLLVLFLVIPLLEIWLLIHVGGYVGAAPTVALVVLTAVVGVTVIRLQGLSALTRANARMRAGEVPAQEMGEGLILALAGVLLLTPGFATDAVGFACLIPPLRRRLLAPWLRKLGRSQQWPPHSGPSESGRTLEGEYRRDDDERLDRDPDSRK